MGVMEVILAYIRRHLGLRTDAASSTGSLHAKAKDIKDYLAANNIVAYGTAIKSIQKGTIGIGYNALSATATISSVTTSKTVVLWGGIQATTGETVASSAIMLTLTNATTITAIRGTSGAGGGGAAVYVAYAVIEFY